MKKFYLVMMALVALATTASAGVKNLYKQDFETVATPADAGWTSPNYAAGMSFLSDQDGRYFQFDLGTQNSRNAVLNFNHGLDADASIFDGQDVKNYSVSFVWHFAQNATSTGNDANVQFSNELAVLNSNWDAAKKNYYINNGQYAAADSLYLFALSQLKGAWQAEDLTKEPPVYQTPYWTDNKDLSSYATDFFINNDKNNIVTLTVDGWYIITLNVDTEARTVGYEIFDMVANDVITNGAGTYNLPEKATVWAKGLNVLLGRYKSVSQIDDIKISSITESDYANKPTVALTEVDMKKRTYSIAFEDGEILNVKTTEGTTETATESPYTYVTETSGTLDVWTVSGTAESEHVTLDVVAEVINLPAAVVDITKVNAGYVKTLKMTVDNSAVPTQPQITMTWEYSNGDKSNGEVMSGELYNATEKGTLTVITKAYGFGATTTTFENDSEYAVGDAVDFQHMEEANLLAKGFVEIDPLQSGETKGETNWTGRKRLWFGIENGEVDDAGNPKHDDYVVYGPADASEVVEPIRRFYLKPSTLTETVSKTIFAPFYTWYTGQADPAVADGSDVAGLKINYGIGLINTGTKTDDGSSINYANGIVGIDGLTDNDYYILYIISDYGSSSKHPIYPQGTTPKEGKELYKAENLGDGTNVQVLRGAETFSLYRIDTAISKVEVYKAVNVDGIETLNYNKVVSDHNAPIYNLNGVQVNPNALQKGIYIKQGKKFIVR